MSGGRTKTKAHRSTCPVWGLWGCSVHGWGSMPRRYRRVHLVFSPAGMLISPLAGKRELLLGSSLHLKPRSLLAPKGGSRSPLSASPPESRRLSPRRGDGRSVWLQHLVQHEGPCPPAFLLCFSPSRCSQPQPSRLSRPWLLARVPTSGQAHRAGRTLKKGLLAQSTFRFAAQRHPPPPSRSSTPVKQKPRRAALLWPRACSPVCQAAFSRLSPLFWGEGGGLNPLSAQGRERREAMPPAPLPGPSPTPSCSVVLYIYH